MKQKSPQLQEVRGFYQSKILNVNSNQSNFESFLDLFYIIQFFPGKEFDFLLPVSKIGRRELFVYYPWRTSHVAIRSALLINWIAEFQPLLDGIGPEVKLCQKVVGDLLI